MKKTEEFIKLLLKTNCLNYLKEEFKNWWVSTESEYYNYLYNNNAEQASNYYDLVDEFDRKLKNVSTNILFNYCLDVRNTELHDLITSDREAVAFVLTYKAFMKNKYSKQINKLVKDAYKLYVSHSEQAICIIYGLNIELEEEPKEEQNPAYYDWDYEPTEEELIDGEPIDCEEF